MTTTIALLYGLETTLAQELADSLALLGVRCRLAGGQESASAQAGIVDIAFASADRARVGPLITELRAIKPELAVVVVSRNPEASQWIDSLEVGADDYCCAPFERMALRWILDANLKRTRQAA